MATGRMPIFLPQSSRLERCWHIPQLTWVPLASCFPVAQQRSRLASQPAGSPPALAGHRGRGFAVASSVPPFSVGKRVLLESWGGGRGSLAADPKAPSCLMASCTMEKLTQIFPLKRRWSHEYQEATIDKIIRFLQGRSSRDSSAGSENGLDCLPSLGQP